MRGIKRHSTNAIISLTEKAFIAYRRSFDVWHRGTELLSAKNDLLKRAGLRQTHGSNMLTGL